MLKVLGSHIKGDGPTMAVLECGHEVAWNRVKHPEETAECPKGCAAKLVTPSTAEK